jgi:hypothetical protein
MPKQIQFPCTRLSVSSIALMYVAKYAALSLHQMHEPFSHRPHSHQAAIKAGKPIDLHAFCDSSFQTWCRQKDVYIVLCGRATSATHLSLSQDQL